MGVLVGILIGLSRLAADSEITAMRASGIGAWTFLRVVSIFAVTAWALALFNAVYLAPASQAALGRLEDRLKASQASFEVQPRVFYEGFPKLVLYVQDVKTAQGAAIWKGVFIADISTPASPRITLARQGILISEGPQMLHLHLTDGATHETDPDIVGPLSDFDFRPDRYTNPYPASRQQRRGTSSGVGDAHMGIAGSGRKVKKFVAPWYYIEFHRRFALPTSCLVLALVGIPLGLSSKKGGKSAGFVLTILLVFAYYSVTLIGVSLARQGKVPPCAGSMAGQYRFLLCGAFLLWRVERRPFEIRIVSRPLESAEEQAG